MITRIRFPPKKRGHRTHLSFRMFYSFFGPEIAPLSFVASLYQSPDEIGPKSNAPNTEILRVVVLEKGHLHKGTRSTNFPAMFLMRGSIPGVSPAKVGQPRGNLFYYILSVGERPWSDRKSHGEESVFPRYAIRSPQNSNRGPSCILATL